MPIGSIQALSHWLPRFLAVRLLPREPLLFEELLDEDQVEMANLPEEDTGVAGTIYISTRMGGHGARVKYFPGRAGEDKPSFSVSISAPARVLANSLPETVVRRMSPAVIAWVGLNREELLRFWGEGSEWSRGEVAAFLAGLRRLNL
jgi:hypothetical protein